MTNNLIRDELREQTRAAHKRAETAKAMHVLMGPALCERQYLSILTTWLAWHYTNEPYIFTTLEDYAPDDINHRSKIPLLESDLKHSKIAIEVTHMGANKLALQNKYQALGALYVLEGSTLGGQIILNQLKKKLSNDFPHRFYTGYGEATYQRWHDFIAHLAAFPLTTPQRQQVVEGANYTFDSIYQSLNNIELQSPS